MKVEQKKWPTEEEYANMYEFEKEQLIIDYYNGAFKDAGFKPTFKEKLKYKLKGFYGTVIGLVIIVVIYGLFNLVIVGGQYIWHFKDNSELKRIEKTLAEQEVNIKMYEEKIYNNTITDSEYADYQNEINDYNENVDEYNEIAEKIGGTYYVLPVPIKK